MFKAIKKPSKPFSDIYMANVAALRSIDTRVLRHQSYGCRLSIELQELRDGDDAPKATVLFSVLPNQVQGVEPVTYTDQYELIQTRYNTTTRVRTLIGTMVNGANQGRNYAFDIDPSRIDEPLTPTVLVEVRDTLGHQFSPAVNIITVVPGSGPVRVALDPRTSKALTRCWRQLRLNPLWAEVLSLDGVANA